MKKTQDFIEQSLVKDLPKCVEEKLSRTYFGTVQSFLEKAGVPTHGQGDPLGKISISIVITTDDRVFIGLSNEHRDYDPVKVVDEDAQQLQAINVSLAKLLSAELLDPRSLAEVLKEAMSKD